MIDCRNCKWITTKEFHKPRYVMHCKAYLLYFSDYYTPDCKNYKEVEERDKNE